MANDQQSSDEVAGSEAPVVEDGGETPKRRRAAAIDRPYPRHTLEEALAVPRALKDHNGGNPWPPSEVAGAISVGPRSSKFYYITAAARDFGLTEGTRDSTEISLKALGREAVYPQTSEQEKDSWRKAFMKIDIFKRVVEYFRGSTLPDKRYLANTLETTFGLDPTIHDEFVELFQKNARFVGVGADANLDVGGETGPTEVTVEPVALGGADASETKTCFVIMPFRERTEHYAIGFFEEVYEALFKPAIQAAGFQVKTAKRQGSDVIQATIVNELLGAELVLADLTEHNPNVLFELGMRMAESKPIALVRAKGTGAIFDVDNMLRVEEYNPSLWPSTVEKDIPRLTTHVIEAWESKDTAPSFLSILRTASGK